MSHSIIVIRLYIYTFIISTRLEFMRYIYNAESSPTMSASMGPFLTGTLTTSMSGSITTTTSAPLLLNSMADTQILQRNVVDLLPESCLVEPITTTQSDLLQCITNCANASRLSLVNLFPSRFDQSRSISRPTNLLYM